MPALEMSYVPQEIASSKKNVVLAEFSGGLYLLICDGNRMVKKGVEPWKIEEGAPLALEDCLEMWRKEEQDPKIAAVWAKAKENYRKQYGHAGHFNNFESTSSYWVKVAKPVRLTAADFQEFDEMTRHCVAIPLPDDDFDDFSPQPTTDVLDN
eukprot:TRINITY_DN4525_c0_g1_i1.p1 TRINITY_DN4525_c0_g1~~TRINITY_DN4525_c0_g1_i1.p1  ORF type:complete len:153 (+),score=30.88 TRINITY_DN4525_c0_g1_i1:69-527(+)